MTALTWRVFFTAMTASFTLNVLLSGLKGDGWGKLSSPGLLDLGLFKGVSYNLYELPLFLAMGVLGGLLGALFNHLNTKCALRGHGRAGMERNRRAALADRLVRTARLRGAIRGPGGGGCRWQG